MPFMVRLFMGCLVLGMEEVRHPDDKRHRGRRALVQEDGEHRGMCSFDTGSDSQYWVYQI